MKVYFGIDCAPATPRPDIYAVKVFEKLSVEPIEPYNKFFGAWEWSVEVTDDFNWDNFKDWIKGYMDNLYEKGYIRGAQWDNK